MARAHSHRAGRAGTLTKVLSFGVLGAAGAMGLSAIVAACSSFGSGDDLDTTQADGSTIDVASPDASGTSDAGDAGNVDFDAACNATFCERFDDGGWSYEWQRTGPSDGLEVDGVAFRSPSSSVELNLLDGGAIRALTRSFAVSHRFELTGWINVANIGTGEMDLFGLHGNDAWVAVLVRRSDGYYFEVSNHGSNVLANGPFPSGTFWPVKIVVDFDQKQASLQLGPNPSSVTTMSFQEGLSTITAPEWRADAGVSVHLGADWTDDATRGHWQMHFDDIEVNIDPDP